MWQYYLKNQAAPTREIQFHIVVNIYDLFHVSVTGNERLNVPAKLHSFLCLFKHISQIQQEIEYRNYCTT